MKIPFFDKITRFVSFRNSAFAVAAKAAKPISLNEDYELADVANMFNDSQFAVIEKLIGSTATKIYNASKQKGIEVFETIGPDYRLTTVSAWLNAMRAADVRQDYDQPHMGLQPDWTSLFNIFANVVQDAQVEGAMNTLLESVKAQPFFIAKADKKKDITTTEIFEQKWLYDYIDTLINSHLYGFSLVQITGVDFAENKVSLKEINRKHVRPDLKGVIRQEYDQKPTAKWDDPKYKKTCIFTFNSNLGKLNKVVRWYIYKTEMARFWSMYNELYGLPPVVGKTSTSDAARKSNMIAGLKNFVRSRFMVLNTEDEVTPFQSNGQGNQQFFENFIRLCDEQISKGLLASTMVLDNGSSRSQSETHADNMKNIVQALSRSIMFSINSELIPRLRNLGFAIPRDAKFVWERSVDSAKMLERANVISTLSHAGYKMSEEVASEFMGIELIEKEEPAPQINPAAKAAMENIYKKTFN